jgi:site-specific DNA-methyltransferase (adenine-specific)
VSAPAAEEPDGRLVLADNLEVLAGLGDASVRLIYIDPPFNTGSVRDRETIESRADPNGARIGFGGRRYSSRSLGTIAYDDAFDDYLGFLEPRLREARRVLDERGTLYVHLDPREAHYVKVLLDEVFGRECFLNEIVWAYDYGGKSKRRWPAKHDTILVYVRDPRRYLFDSTEVDREPYMAPGLVGPDKADRGKLPTDVWWHTIVPTAGAEKTGYPTQKPEGVLRRIVTASSEPGDLCLDFFAGSGTLGAVAAALGRRYLLVDSSPDAVAVMEERLGIAAERPKTDRLGT